MMRAISLWQPWASLMCDPKRKRVETRSWPTDYRGELAIHAAKRKPTMAECGGSPMEYQKAMSCVPFGAVVCVVQLEQCRGVEWVVAQDWFTEEERQNGDYTPGVGRYGWITNWCRPLKVPVPAVGRQGLFWLDPEVEEKVRSQL